MASGKGASDSQSGGPRFKSHSGAYWSFRYKSFRYKSFRQKSQTTVRKKVLEGFHENINNINSKYEGT